MGSVTKIEDLKGKIHWRDALRFPIPDISARFADSKRPACSRRKISRCFQLGRIREYSRRHANPGGVTAGRALPDPFYRSCEEVRPLKKSRDIAEAGVWRFPFVGIVCQEILRLKDNMDTVQRFARAYRRSHRYLTKIIAKLAMKITSKYTGIKDPAILASDGGFLRAQVAARAISGPLAGLEIRARPSCGARCAREKTTRLRRLWTRASSNSSKTVDLSKGLYPKG